MIIIHYKMKFVNSYFTFYCEFFKKSLTIYTHWCIVVQEGVDTVSMTAGEKIKTIMARQKVSMGEMAEQTGQSRQNLSNKMKRDDFSESEIRKMAAVIGCTVDIVFRDSEGNIVL